jgi:hypothetical protein
MSRKAVVAGAILIMLLGVATWVWFRRNPAPGPAGPTAVAAEMAALLAASGEDKNGNAPDIGLIANRDLEMPLLRGMPLILMVSVTNERAANTAADNAIQLEMRQGVEARAARGDLAKARADRWLSHHPAPRQIPAVTFGSQGFPWQRWVHFTATGSGGSDRPLDWPLQAWQPASAPAISLGADSLEILYFILSPETSQRISPGRYEIKALLEAPPGYKPRNGEWAGSVRSAPHTMNVVDMPANPSAAEAERIALSLADYYVFVKQWNAAAEQVQKVLAHNSASIEALAFSGDVKEAQGDARGALDAYLEARDSYQQKHPSAPEPPLYLIKRTQGLMQKLLAK